MELIDRYVEQSVRLLPSEERAEAAERLRESIWTRIRSRTGEASEKGEEATAGPVPEQTVVDVLQALGPPEEVAASLGRRQDGLIAPHLRRPFLTAATLSLVGLLIATLFDVLTGPGGVGSEDGTALDLLLRLVAALDDYLLKAVVVLTVVVAMFVFMGHTVEGAAAARRRWTPRDLISKDPDRVQRGNAILEIALLGAVLVAFNLFHFQVGAHVTIGDEHGWVPVLSPALRAQVVWLDLWLLGTIALDGWLLWRGRWNALLRCVSSGLKLVMAAVLWRARQGGTLVAVDSAWMAGHGWSAEAIESYGRLMGGPVQEGLRLAVACLLVAVLISAVVELARAVASAWRTV